MKDLLRVNAHGLVDLFEEHQGCVFRFPAEEET